MNHVKYLRAGPAEMPFENRYTGGVITPPMQIISMWQILSDGNTIITVLTLKVLVIKDMSNYYVVRLNHTDSSTTTIFSTKFGHEVEVFDF